MLNRDVNTCILFFEKLGKGFAIVFLSCSQNVGRTDSQRYGGPDPSDFDLGDFAIGALRFHACHRHLPLFFQIDQWRLLTSFSNDATPVGGKFLKLTPP
jgi:hypothetical protein